MTGTTPDGSAHGAGVGRLGKEDSDLQGFSRPSSGGWSGLRQQKRTVQFNADDSTRLPRSYLEDVLAGGGASSGADPLRPNQSPRHQAGAGSHITAVSRPPPVQAMLRHPAGPFGTRHQSVDVARAPRGQVHAAGPVFGVPRPSAADTSHLSGVSLGGPAQLYDEARKNNLAKISKMMEPYLVGRRTSGSHTGRDTQQRNRNFKNSF